MKIRFSVLIALALPIAADLTGCSTIAGWFPDKQKQYRYSSDLPPLEIPPDLTSSTIEGAVTAKESRSAESTESVADVSDEKSEKASKSSSSESGSSSDDSSERTPVQRPSRSKSIKPTLAQDSDDAPLIEIDEPFSDAWNDVHRALGRLEVEVTDQNRSGHVFYVHYAGPDKPKKSDEKGLWSDIKSIFSASDTGGQDLRVKLEPNEESTNIYVQDTADKVTTTGLGLDLLKHLQTTLQKLDQPETSSTEGESGSDKSP